MVFARITAITYALRKKYLKRKGIDVSQQQSSKHYLEKYVEATRPMTKRLRKLRYRKYPYAVWFFAFMFMGLAGTMLWYILSNRHLLFEEFDHFSLIGKYFICISIFLIGFIAFLTSEIYTLEINKYLGIVAQMRKNLMCRKRFDFGKLSGLKDIIIVRRGHQARDTDTTYFILEFQFEELQKLDTISDRKLKDAKKKYADIMIFLERDGQIQFNDVKYRDESTATHRFVYKSPFETESQQKQREKLNNRVINEEKIPLKSKRKRQEDESTQISQSEDYSLRYHEDSLRLHED